MIRTLNADIFNLIANNENVRPFLGGTDELNLTNIIQNPYNFCFLNENKTGGYILISKRQILSGQVINQGVYEVHTISLPEARGRSMLSLMRKALDFMFLETDCLELQTFIPDNFDNVQLWGKFAGFRDKFRRDKCFNFNGNLIGGTYYSVEYSDWVINTNKNLQIGKQFHSAIDKFELLSHPDDAIHDYWAGAMCRSRNLPKAISEYNKWAARTGYVQLSIVTLTPLVLDLQSAVLQLNADNTISILKVKDKCLLEPQLVHLLPEV